MPGDFRGDNLSSPPRVYLDYLGVRHARVGGWVRVGLRPALQGFSPVVSRFPPIFLGVLAIFLDTFRAYFEALNRAGEMANASE